MNKKKEISYILYSVLSTLKGAKSFLGLIADRYIRYGRCWEDGTGECPKRERVSWYGKKKMVGFWTLDKQKNTKGQIICTGSKSTGMAHSRKTVS
jgi:hypothetical protein